MADTDKANTLGKALFAAMKAAIDDGMNPNDAVETGIGVIGDIAIQLDGPLKTGGKLIVVGQALVDSSPEMMARRGQAAN